MTFAENLYAYLLSRADIVALVAARIYPMKLPQRPTLPALTFQRVANAPEYSHDPGAAHMPLVQITAWADTYKEAEALSTLVSLAVDAWGSVMVGAAFVSNIVDLSEPATKVYQVAVDAAFEGVSL